MAKLVVPDLAVLRDWLEQLGIAFFECEACQALHFPHLQNISGIFDAKVDLIENVIVFSALADVRPTGLIPLVADLSQINASILNAKVFVDIQDDNLPKLVICQTLSIGPGVAFEQFSFFLQESEEQALQIVMEAQTNELLIMAEADDDSLRQMLPVSYQLH